MPLNNCGMMTALLTETETADLLKLTTRQVLRFAKRGLLRAVRLPNAEVRFDPADVAGFIESCKAPTESRGAA